MAVLHVLVFAGGVLVVYWTLMSAVRTFVLPRAASVALTRVPFVLLRDLFRLRMRWSHDYEARDAVMALYAPVGLLLLPVLYTQRFTTREPDDGMLEVAITAFNAAREGERTATT